MGDGWKTYAEIKNGMAESIGDNRLRASLAAMLADGSLEVFTGTQTVNARLVRAVWYRPKIQ